jgi:ketosteroid isomerase-like protein
MITRRRWVELAGWTVSAAAVAATPARADEKAAGTDKDRIAAATQSFITAYNAGDLQGVMSHYTDDLVKCRQGGSIENKKDVGARMFLVFRDFTGDLYVTNEEIEVHGDMAFTRGTFKAVLTPKAGGKEQIFERRFLEILRKEGNSWLVARTMDNTAGKR